jgi:hypothetical protein
MMLEDKHADRIYHERKVQQAIRKYTGGEYEIPEERAMVKDHHRPEGWTLPGPKRRHPAHTRFKRLETTVQRDRKARDLRALGYSYQEIADIQGYASRQAAHLAVKRGQKDFEASSSLIDKRARARVPSHADKHAGSSRDDKQPGLSTLTDFSGNPKYGRARGRQFPRVDSRKP